MRKYLVMFGSTMILTMGSRAEAQNEDYRALRSEIEYLARDDNPDIDQMSDFKQLRWRFIFAEKTGRPVDLSGLRRSVLLYGAQSLGETASSQLIALAEPLPSDVPLTEPQEAESDTDTDTDTDTETASESAGAAGGASSSSGGGTATDGSTASTASTATFQPLRESDWGTRTPKNIRRVDAAQGGTIQRGIDQSNSTWRRDAPDDANRFTKNRREDLDQAMGEGFTYQSTQYKTLQADFLKGDVPMVKYAHYTPDQGLYKSEARPASVAEVYEIMTAAGSSAESVRLSVRRMTLQNSLDLARRNDNAELVSYYEREIESTVADLREEGVGNQFVNTEDVLTARNPKGRTLTRRLRTGQSLTADGDTVGGNNGEETFRGEAGPSSLPDVDLETGNQELLTAVSENNEGKLETAASQATEEAPAQGATPSDLTGGTLDVAA